MSEATARVFEANGIQMIDLVVTVWDGRRYSIEFPAKDLPLVHAALSKLLPRPVMFGEAEPVEIE